MAKKKDIEKLVNDPVLYERMKAHLYSKQPILGADSPFSELLQQMVNKMPEGELDNFLEEDQSQGNSNKRNGRTSKQVLSDSGPLWNTTPRSE